MVLLYIISFKFTIICLAQQVNNLLAMNYRNQANIQIQWGQVQCYLLLTRTNERRLCLHKSTSAVLSSSASVRRIDATNAALLRKLNICSKSVA